METGKDKDGENIVFLLEAIRRRSSLLLRFGLKPIIVRFSRVQIYDWFSRKSKINGCAELSTGRMDPRVGSGRIGSRFCRILAGRVGSALRIF